MEPSFLFVRTYAPEFLDQLYSADCGLAALDYETQLQRIFDTAFATADAYSHELRALGSEAREVIVNADRLQARWAGKHGLNLTGNIHERRRQIVAAQVRHYRPHVLYVFEWCPLGDLFLAEMKSLVRLLVGQIASPLRPERTYGAYDLMISSWPPIVDYFRNEGVESELMKLAFDRRVADKLVAQPPRYDVTFVGGFAPSHPDRIAWLEGVLEEINIDIFGYGLERVARDSPVRKHHRGPVWGWQMYQVLQESRITLNRHARIEVRGTFASNVANNMRLFEATGVGTCLLTELKDNLPEMFEPGREVVTYCNDAQCAERIRYYLAHEDERVDIARAGQRRTLRDHCQAARMKDLLENVRRRL
jgi:hypothetical protein